jgi:hypothetical protein
MHEMNVLDLRPATFGLFDVVLFPGVLYHLRYPFWSLKLIRDVLVNNGTLVIETGILAGGNKRALMHCPIGKDSPYEPTSCTFYNLKGLTDTLESLGLSVGHLDTLLKTHLRMGNDALPDVDGPLPTDRAMLVCQRIAERAKPGHGVYSNSVLDLYWNGSHSLHTRHQDNTQANTPKNSISVSNGASV